LAARFFAFSIGASCDDGMPRRAKQSSRTPSGALRTISAI
jgi:hypothetical protein